MVMFAIWIWNQTSLASQLRITKIQLRIKRKMRTLIHVLQIGYIQLLELTMMVTL